MKYNDNQKINLIKKLLKQGCSDRAIEYVTGISHVYIYTWRLARKKESGKLITVSMLKFEEKKRKINKITTEQCKVRGYITGLMHRG